MKVCFGVDLGGTSIKFGMFSADGNLIEKWEIPTRPGESVFQDVADEIRAKTAEHGLELKDLLGVGIGVPGPVQENGYVEVCVNLDLRYTNFPQRLSKLLDGVKVVATNDANAAALGESWHGGGQNYRHLMLITLGTGVGSGIVLNGKVVNGARGVAGEVGHVVVDLEEKEHCKCGAQGCLEQVASATGVVRHTKRFLHADPDGEKSSLSKITDLTARDVIDAAKAGDELAQKSLEYCMEFLGKAIADLGQIIDPEAFMIGGGLSHAGPFLLDIIVKYYKLHSVFSKKRVDIVLAQLGNDAGIQGAAKLILD
ncbi:MAG: ROK family glucokinase [Bacillota bacterium]|nr:ROK family glucokinase [Bacillota bacterium]